MELEEQVHLFIKNPFPLWETTLTTRLVEHKWQQFQKEKLINQENYSTAGAWFRNVAVEGGKAGQITSNEAHSVYLELPSSSLQSFYDEHGLELLSEQELKAENAISKLSGAFAVLQQVLKAYECGVSLVKNLQVLRSHDADVDLSYSHPNIPFSIFLSLCEDESPVSNLRVAESILHEAMHLKLTLIENIVPLVSSNDSVFYSPWKNEKRPLRGVLHGLFVFKAILDFLNEVTNIFTDAKVVEYLEFRKEQIATEIRQLEGLSLSPELTQEGANLSKNLLP